MVRFLRGAVPVMLGLVLSAWCAPEGTAIAQQASGTVSPAKKAQAQQRFTKAKALYKQGKYRAAVEELEEARKLDPESPDLVYNLAVVHEKLVEIDKAIEHYKLFVGMTDNADEIARVQGIIQRLEGAKTEVAPTASAAPAASSGAEPPPPPPPPAAPKEPEKNGRFDGLVIASGVVAVAGLATGIVFGLKAKGDEITGTPRTDPSTSYQDLQDRNDSAKKNALFADIGFGVAIVGGVAGALLYFTRSAEPSKEQAPGPSASTVSRPRPWTPSVALLPGGGAMAGIGGGF